jgi:hypothetical protein
LNLVVSQVFLLFIKITVYASAAQPIASLALERACIRYESRKKPEAREMFVSRDESHQSAERCIGRQFTYSDK